MLPSYNPYVGHVTGQLSRGLIQQLHNFRYLWCDCYLLRNSSCNNDLILNTYDMYLKYRRSRNPMLNCLQNLFIIDSVMVTFGEHNISMTKLLECLTVLSVINLYPYLYRQMKRFLVQDNTLHIVNNFIAWLMTYLRRISAPMMLALFARNNVDPTRNGLICVSQDGCNFRYGNTLLWRNQNVFYHI